jgi:hypothetical protein
MKEKWKGNEKGNEGEKGIKEICKVTEAGRRITYFCAVYCRSMTAMLKSQIEDMFGWRKNVIAQRDTA